MCIIVLLVFYATANAMADNERDLIIQKTMGCLEQHMNQNSSVAWDDVCYTPLPQTDYSVADASTPKHYDEFDIAPEISYISYREPGLKVKESGMMYGINGSYTYRVENNQDFYTKILNMGRLEGLFSYGKVDYHGGLQNLDGSYAGSDNFNGINDYMVEARGLAGRDFKFNNDSIRLTPYIGIGGRSLFDSDGENKPYGYNRWIRYVYIPTGVEAMTKLIDGWSIGADAEYDIFLYGRVTSYLGEAGLGDLENTQTRGFGLRGSIKLVKEWQRFNIILEPFVRYWHIYNSGFAPSTPYYYNGSYYYVLGEEPNNSSLEVGGKLGVEF